MNYRKGFDSKEQKTLNDEEKVDEVAREEPFHQQHQEKQSAVTADSNRAVSHRQRTDKGDDIPTRSVAQSKSRKSSSVESNNGNRLSCPRDVIQGDQIDFTHDDVDDSDDETQPGAFRMAGMRTDDDTTDEATLYERNTDSDDDDDDDHHHHHHDYHHQNATTIVEAEQVDEEALEREYQEKARQAILDRIKEETTTHAVQVESSDAASNERPKQSRYRWMPLFLLLVCAIVVPIVIVRSSSNSQHKSKDSIGQDHDNENDITDFDFVQEQILQQLSDNSTKRKYRDYLRNSSTAQYKALDWLVHTDPSMLNAREAELSTLIDRYVLAVLYFSTNGPNWLYSQRFLSNYSVCDWGIDCDVTNSIVAINLDENNLQGTIPMELSLLTSLEEISLAFNSLSGTIPSELGRLSRLEKLQLPFNSLTGSIPDEFQYLTSLEKLYLGINQLTGTIPTGFIQLPLLEVFQIDYNLLSGTIPEMNPQQQQASFESLALDSNTLSGSIPDSVFILKDLEKLFLGENQLKGSIPSEIGMLTKLEVLMLGENDFNGTIPTSIGELEFLRFLSLDRNPRLAGTIPTEFGMLASLESGFLFASQFTGTLPPELGKLTRLNTFYIDSNPLTGTVPSTFSRLTVLESLGLSDTNLTGDLDIPICNQTNRIRYLQADCLDPTPEVSCSCCTTCCNEDSGCYKDTHRACKNLERDLELNILQNQATCTCIDDVHVHCDLTKCPICKEDLSVCGVMTEFQYTLNEFAGPTQWRSTIQYQTGQHANHTLSWEYHFRSAECHAFVNGIKCNICTIASCEDGFRGKYIDCNNVLNVDGPLEYHSCYPQEASSVLDIMRWVDFHSWTGCPFAPAEYIL